MIIGITGGMGCGKSTAAKLLAEHGYQLIDSDRLVREQILTSGEIVALARERWGEAILGADGGIDRQAMSERVFADTAELRILESWVHPRVFALWRETLAATRAQDTVIEVPLLFEKGLENWFDFIVCVASSADVQLARLTQRGVPHALAGQRISKQLPLARKIALADLVLWNDGTLSFLREQVESLHRRLSGASGTT